MPNTRRTTEGDRKATKKLRRSNKIRGKARTAEVLGKSKKAAKLKAKSKKVRAKASDKKYTTKSKFKQTSKGSVKERVKKSFSTGLAGDIHRVAKKAKDKKSGKKLRTSK